MGGNQTSLCTTNEKHDHGNASGGVLRQWRPSSLTTHRSSPSLSLFSSLFPSPSPSIPLWSLTLPHRFSFSIQPLVPCPPPSTSPVYVSAPARASFLFSSRILIFFINFSQALQTILRLPRFLRFSISLLRDVRTRSSPPYSVFPNPWSGALLRMHPRRPLSFSRTTNVFGPFAVGVVGARPCPSARTSPARSLARLFAKARFPCFAPSRLSFPPRIFRR